MQKQAKTNIFIPNIVRLYEPFGPPFYSNWERRDKLAHYHYQQGTHTICVAVNIFKANVRITVKYCDEFLYVNPK